MNSSTNPLSSRSLTFAAVSATGRFLSKQESPGCIDRDDREPGKLTGKKAEDSLVKRISGLGRKPSNPKSEGGKPDQEDSCGRPARHFQGLQGLLSELPEAGLVSGYQGPKKTRRKPTRAAEAPVTAVTTS